MKRFFYRSLVLFFLSAFSALLFACETTTTQTVSSTTETSSSTTTGTTTSGTNNSSTTTPTTTAIGWDGNRVTYNASVIRNFGSGTPAGTTNYNASQDTVAIWNIDASLDNYGGVQTPTLSLDFSKAVIFQMEVESVYSQYIVKLAVAGESEYYYVLADDGRTGTISINVVDAMLSTKFRVKNTQPDPGYATGWKYANQIKNCSFHILAKGPDGEKQTAELVLKSITITNDQAPITHLSIQSDSIENNRLTQLKGAESITLSAIIAPETAIDQTVFWTSLDETVATVDEFGTVSFVGVGVTQIRATSTLDQSKSADLFVDVQSGFEDVELLTSELASLTYGGSSADLSTFQDLFQTTWGTGIDQSIGVPLTEALSARYDSQTLVIENYFSGTVSAHVQEATLWLASGQAMLPLSLNGDGTAIVYRNINGSLSTEPYSGALDIAYATNAGGWQKKSTYSEQGIVVWSSGDVRKYEILVVATTMIASYTAADFANTALWTIPDRTKQTIDPIVHALSPATVSIVDSLAVMHQNKYPEAKYCFGGIASNILHAEPLKDVQIILDVASLNQLSDYVKTMWELKIIYYQNDGVTVVSSNPLKLDSGNTSGVHTLTFHPAYSYFRIYLVVNGSDIGAQFSDAEMQIRSLKIQTLDQE